MFSIFLVRGRRKSSGTRMVQVRSRLGSPCHFWEKFTHGRFSGNLCSVKNLHTSLSLMEIRKLSDLEHISAIKWDVERRMFDAG